VTFADIPGIDFDVLPLSRGAHFHIKTRLPGIKGLKVKKKAFIY